MSLDPIYRPRWWQLQGRPLFEIQRNIVHKCLGCAWLLDGPFKMSVLNRVGQDNLNYRPLSLHRNIQQPSYVCDLGYEAWLRDKAHHRTNQLACRKAIWCWLPAMVQEQYYFHVSYSWYLINGQNTSEHHQIQSSARFSYRYNSVLIIRSDPIIEHRKHCRLHTAPALIILDGHDKCELRSK